MRPRISVMRGWKPFTSNTLKSPALNAAAGIGVSLVASLLQVVEGEDRPPHVREREPSQIGRRQPGRVDLEDRAGDRLERGTVVHGGFHHQELLGGGIEAAAASHLGEQRLPPEEDEAEDEIGVVSY